MTRDAHAEGHRYTLYRESLKGLNAFSRNHKFDKFEKSILFEGFEEFEGL